MSLLIYFLIAVSDKGICMFVLSFLDSSSDYWNLSTDWFWYEELVTALENGSLLSF